MFTWFDFPLLVFLSHPLGTSVAQLTATDGDVSDSITITIQSGDDATPKFVVNNQLIETTSNAIDYDSLTGQNFMYTLVVRATDGTNTGTATVYVSVCHVEAVLLEKCV